MDTFTSRSSRDTESSSDSLSVFFHSDCLWLIEHSQSVWILAQSQDLMIAHWDLVRDHLRSLGLCANLQKSDLLACQQTTFLGVDLNSPTCVQSLWTCHLSATHSEELWWCAEAFAWMSVDEAPFSESPKQTMLSSPVQVGKTCPSLDADQVSVSQSSSCPRIIWI